MTDPSDEYLNVSHRPPTDYDYHVFAREQLEVTARTMPPIDKNLNPPEPYIQMSTCQSHAQNEYSEAVTDYMKGEYVYADSLNARPNQYLEVFDANCYYETINYETFQQNRSYRKLIIAVIILVLILGTLLTGLLLWRVQNSSSSIELYPEFCTNVPNILTCRRAFIRNMTQTAFAVYRQFAWGADTVNPVTRRSNNYEMFPGEAIVASMSTLYIMGLGEEWNLGKQWITEDLDLSQVDKNIFTSVTVGVYLGGLLSAYALSGEVVFLEKAQQIATVLEPAFSPTTGMLANQFNPKEKTPVNGSTYYLSYIGFQQPEFFYLSALTNDSSMLDRLKLIRRTIELLPKPNGLYMSEIDIYSGQWTTSAVTLNRGGKLLYYNLLRSLLQGGRGGLNDRNSTSMYIEAISALIEAQLFKILADGRLYVRDYRSKPKIHEYWMHNSHCQLGAMLALGAKFLERLGESQAEMHLELAINLTETCYQTAHRTPTRLLPVEFMFEEILDPKGEISYELAESYFFLWRTTHDSRYRQYAWELAQAFYHHSRALSGGYGDVKNVSSLPTELDDYQDTDFLASTVKYLWLTFSDDGVLPLEQWFFTERGHPLPVCGTNRRFRVC